MEYDLAGTIIGCAMKVHRALGPGFLESVYQRSLMIELRGIKLPAEELKSIKVYYADEVVGDFVADILINDELIH